MYLLDEWKVVEKIASPLNYIGGKYRLLNQITPLFPQNIYTFVDLFCGGCNVGINAPAKKVVFNDSNETLIELLKMIQRIEKDELFSNIETVISRYGLSESTRYGYQYYRANGSDGLANYNRDAFLSLRSDFNSLSTKDEEYYILLYVLIIYAFNNQIRFNRNGKYNLPVGKRDFNFQMQKKLSAFWERVHYSDFRFVCRDYRLLDISKLTEDDFVYIDPPYLITCATYNEQNGWNETEERNLLYFLDILHHNNIRFALSNVLRCKGKENSLLINWVEKNRNKYSVIPLTFSYANSNYHTKYREGSTEEILVVNYK